MTCWLHEPNSKKLGTASWFPKSFPHVGVMRNHTLKQNTILAAVVMMLTAAACGGTANTIGQRPYEMVWANRAQDHCPPLVDFEDLTGWRVEGKGAVAHKGKMLDLPVVERAGRVLAKARR